MTSTQAEHERRAERIVSRILADLMDRRGLRQAWDAMDNDIADEVIETWDDIVRQELKP